MGLNMYQAMNAEARANRQEQFQRDRAARQDFESDRSYNYNVKRDEVEDDRWERNFEEGIRQFDEGLKISERQVATQEGNLKLNRDRFNYAVDEAERVRNETQILNRANASLYGPDGQRLTGQALVERLNRNPQEMKDLLSAAVINGLMTEERASRYTGGRVVPIGNNGDFALMVAGRTEDGSPIPPGGAPLTVNGTTSPDDEVIVFNPDRLALMLDPEGHRAAMRDNALIDMDAQAERGVEEDRIAKERKEAEAEIAGNTARIAELEAKRKELQDAYVSWATGDRYGPRRATGSNTREAVERVAELQRITDEIESLGNAISRRQANLEKNEQHYSQSLANIDWYAQRNRIEGNYLERRTEQHLGAQRALGDADKANRATVDTAVKEINAALKARYGKEASHLDPNMVQAQYDRLPPEIRRRLASHPGLLRRAVSHMGENGLTSFEYLLDLTDVNDEGMQYYYRAAGDPAVASQVGDDPDMVHAVAKAVATHMTANPGVSYKQTMEAVLSGKPLPEKNSSLGAALGRAADKWVAPGVRDMFR